MMQKLHNKISRFPVNTTNTSNLQNAERNSFANSKSNSVSNFDFNKIPIQAKLKINTPGDRYEQEADRIADKVVNMNASVSVDEHTNQQINRKPLLAEISKIDSISAQRKCSQCEEEEEMIQRKTGANSSPISADSISSQLNATRGMGSAMDLITNQYMSSRFGVDFSSVNIHNNATATQMSKSINARAFAVGNDIYFNSGEYNPNTTTGKRLLAHELTHVVQQTYSNNTIQRQVPIITGPSLDIAVLNSLITCLNSLQAEMRRQTQNYVRSACNQGDYLTSQSNVRYIPEDHADAFGHCWIACEGTKRCGEDGTRFLGIGREYFREVLDIIGIWEHNSFDEDVHNQNTGRALAQNNPAIDSYDLTYNAITSGLLRFHGKHSGEDPERPLVYICNDITLDDHTYRRGWRSIPQRFLD